ncbi:MAG: XisI protein [Cyanobacteria bacterium P01_F01_bin.150]
MNSNGPSCFFSRSFFQKEAIPYELDKEQPSPDVDPVLAFDEVRDCYFWFQVGWDRTGRTCRPTAYIRLVNGKVWIEEDLTEDGIANDFIEAGVPKTDIVLGFQHPRVWLCHAFGDRPFTEFAVA